MLKYACNRLKVYIVVILKAFREINRNFKEEVIKWEDIYFLTTF